jgi:uncharacterized membrane protein
MRTERIIDLLSLGLVVLAFVLVAAVYDRLPEHVPTHWNAGGAIDARMAKPWGPFVLPVTMAGVFVLLLVLPRISPHDDMDPFRPAYGAIQLAVLGLLFALSVSTLLAGLGWAVPVNRVVPVGIGVLLVISGNFMGKVTTNHVEGIRTRWTLADPEVWLRTHRFAGKVLVFAGLASVIADRWAQTCVSWRRAWLSPLSRRMSIRMCFITGLSGSAPAAHSRFPRGAEHWRRYRRLDAL